MNLQGAVVRHDHFRQLFQSNGRIWICGCITMQLIQCLNANNQRIFNCSFKLFLFEVAVQILFDQIMLQQPVHCRQWSEYLLQTFSRVLIMSTVTLILVFLVVSNVAMDIYDANTVIPVIDLRQNDEIIASKLYSAATHYGFFYLIGHNVSTQQKDDLFEQSLNFFNLADSIKHSLLYVPGETFGYTPFESETLNQTLSTYGDTKESFYLCDDSIDFDENIQWSSQNLWPSEDVLPKFRGVATKYFDAMSALGYKMNEYVALSLNLSKNYFSEQQIFGQEPMAVLRLIHYFPILSDEGIGRFGAGQHTDYGFMTFLVTDGNEGLQIYDDNTEEWLDVKGDVSGYEDEAVIIVNIGDQLQRSTNDRFLSTKHRVVTRQEIDRYSVAFFWEPALDAVVECVESICGEGASVAEMPKYEPITHREHLMNKISATYSKPGSVKNEL